MSENCTLSKESGELVDQKPKALAIFESGVTNSKEFAQGFSALMSDAIAGRLSPGIVNAVCNAGGKMLKVVEMEMRYGTNGPGNGRKTLALSE